MTKVKKKHCVRCERSDYRVIYALVSLTKHFVIDLATNEMFSSFPFQ